jgi:hypothetical protein
MDLPSPFSTKSLWMLPRHTRVRFLCCPEKTKFRILNIHDRHWGRSVFAVRCKRLFKFPIPLSVSTILFPTYTDNHNHTFLSIYTISLHVSAYNQILRKEQPSTLALFFTSVFYPMIADRRPKHVVK